MCAGVCSLSANVSGGRKLAQNLHIVPDFPRSKGPLLFRFTFYSGPLY